MSPRITEIQTGSQRSMIDHGMLPGFSTSIVKQKGTGRLFAVMSKKLALTWCLLNTYNYATNIIGGVGYTATNQKHLIIYDVANNVTITDSIGDDSIFFDISGSFPCGRGLFFADIGGTIDVFIVHGILSLFNRIFKRRIISNLSLVYSITTSTGAFYYYANSTHFFTNNSPWTSPDDKKVGRYLLSDGSQDIDVSLAAEYDGLAADDNYLYTTRLFSLTRFDLDWTNPTGMGSVAPYTGEPNGSPVDVIHSAVGMHARIYNITNGVLIHDFGFGNVYEIGSVFSNYAFTADYLILINANTRKLDVYDWSYNFVRTIGI